MHTVRDLEEALRASEQPPPPLAPFLEIVARDEAPRRSRANWNVATALAALSVLAIAAATAIAVDRGRTPGGPTSPTGTSHAAKFTYVAPTTPGTLIPIAQRQLAASISGDLLGGGTFDLAAHRGAVVVVNFWASWCEPCIEQAPVLERLAGSTTEPVTVLGVDTDDSARSGSAFAYQKHLTYPIVLDPNAELIQQLLGVPDPEADPSSVYNPDTAAKAVGLPVTVLIDKQGRVAAVYLGGVGVHDNSLTTAVTELARE